MRRKQLSLLVILPLLLQTTAVRADKVDDYVKAEMQKQRIPGLSLDKLSIIVLTNCGVARPEAIVRGVATIYLPDLTASVAK
jgi:hypothetical protein